MSVVEVQRDAVTLAKILAKLEWVESPEQVAELNISREAMEIVLEMYQTEDWR